MTPLLVVDEVQRDPQRPRRLAAALRFGGHRLRAVFEFPQQAFGVIEHVELPWLLATHAPSQRAIIELLGRIERGDAVALPHDLSDVVRAADPPFPLRPLDPEARARLDAAAARVPLSVRALRRAGAAPARVTAELSLAGRDFPVEVELYEAADAVPVMRWIRGPDLSTLSDVERYAIQRALGTAT